MLIELDIDNKEETEKEKVSPCIIAFVSDIIIVTYFMPTIIKTGTNDSLYAVWLKDSVLTAAMDKRTRLFFNVSKRSPEKFTRFILSCKVTFVMSGTKTAAVKCQNVPG